MSGSISFFGVLLLVCCLYLLTFEQVRSWNWGEKLSIYMFGAHVFLPVVTIELSLLVYLGSKIYSLRKRNGSNERQSLEEQEKNSNGSSAEA